MKAFRIIGMGVAIALVSSAALAFQEQQGGAGAPAAPAAAPQAEKGAQIAPAEATPAPAGAGGTEIRIPGLGRLGVLPKMDFGLELLYGANDPKPATEQPRDNSEDLTIRGSIKHRF